MPTSSSIITSSRAFNRLSGCLLLILFPFIVNAQTLTGLWIGAVSQDSTTIRKDQSFEIVLTEYKGKVYGYSRSEFIVEDVLYYIVKRVEGTIEGDVCEVTDDEIVACNFPKKPEKGVKVTSTFRRNGSDGEWYLDGTWKTNKTKNYYSISGKISLAEEKDLNASKIFPHLEELKKANDIAFYKERKEGIPIVKLVKPERDDKASFVNPAAFDPSNGAGETLVQAAPIPVNRALQNAAVTEEEPVIKKIEPVYTEQATNTKNLALVSTAQREEKDPVMTATEAPSKSFTQASDLNKEKTDEVSSEVSRDMAAKKIGPTYTEVNKEQKDLVLGKTDGQHRPVTAEQPSRSFSQASETSKERSEQAVATVKAVKQTVPAETSPDPYVDEMNVDLSKLRKTQQPQATPQKKVEAVEQKASNTVNYQSSSTPAVTVSPIPKVITAPHERGFAAMDVNERRTEVSQVVEFSATTDSIQIALYDNGQIDGDTVSVLMNGEVILSKQGLKATAIKHTIHLSTNVEEFNIVLYAENLGTLPPNTGLVVVRDGKDVYNLRFSSDYSKNTGIVFRRKK